MSIYAQIKTCSICKESKPLTEFSKNKRRTDGYNRECKSCTREYKKQYYHRNKKKIDDINKLYWVNNKERLLEGQKEYRNNNRESIKETNSKWLDANREKVQIYQKEYKKRNKESIKRYKKEWSKNRIKTDGVFKFKLNLRALVRSAIKKKGYKKNTKTESILGCDYQTLFEYFESKFTPEMNWDNYGSYWDIDHIIPLATAITESEVIRLNHYTNLQPLGSYYNRYIKRANIID